MKILNKIKELKNILLLLGIILICIGGIFALNFNAIENPTYEFESNLYTVKHPIDMFLPVRIDSTFYVPKEEYNWYFWTQRKMPVIIFQHGFSCDKQFFKGLAFEFARRGFACITLTARGSHGSGGVLGMTYENEILTAVDYLELLANAGLPFDMNRIGLVGHSMGAYSVTIAAAIDDRINATIAIAGPLANVTQGGPILDFIADGEMGMNFHRIPYFMPGLVPYIQYPIGYWGEIFSGNAEVVSKNLNITNPKNYLNIIGTMDWAFSVFSAQEVLWEMGLKDPPYNVTNYWQVLRNYLYGDFNGSARKLVTIPTTEHIFEPNHPVTIYESINWMEKSMKLTHPIYGSIEYLMYQVLFRDSTREILRVSAPWIDMLGVLMIFLPITVYLGNWLKGKYTQAKVATEIENKKIWLLFLLYGIAFISISLITWPFIEALKIVPWTDFLGTNILHMFLVIQSVLFLPILIGLIIYEHRKFNETWEDFGIHPRAFPKSALFGILLALFIFVILNLVITPTYFNIFVVRPGSFFEIFIYMLFVFAISEILFRGLIQTKLTRYNNEKLRFVSKYIPAWKEFLLSALITGIIQGVGIGIMFSFFLQSVSIVPMYSPITIIGGCIGGFFVLSLINNWLYRKTRNVLGLIIFNAFFFSWISTLLPAISGAII